MTTIRFNPLTYANDLKNVGFDPAQAEKLAQLQEEIITSNENNLVTKNDLMLSMANLKIELGSLMIKSCVVLGSVIITLMTIFKFV